MSRSLRAALVVSVLVAGAGPVLSAGDPWLGRSRDDVVALLGEPSKAKPSAHGATLTYKLARPHTERPAPPGGRVISVPGVGVVVRMPEPGAPAARGESLGSIEVDEHGRPLGTGVEQPPEEYSVTWSKGGERTVESTFEEPPALGKKLTLKFELDAAGLVAGWSVSPKSEAAGR